MDICWIKPSGVEVTTNDHPANIAHAEALGWTREGHGESSPSVVDARGLPHDERINTKNQSVDDAGNWKYGRGVDAGTIAAVEAELSLALVDGA